MITFCQLVYNPQNLNLRKKIFFLKKKKASKNFPSSSSLSVSGEGFLASRSPIFVPAGKQSAAARSVASQETQKENARIFWLLISARCGAVGVSVATLSWIICISDTTKSVMMPTA